VHTVRYLRQEGRFARATKVGRRLFWDEHEIDEWLERQKETA
jgi:predicted DNA-binding transcriptional regulator AlpA